MTDDQIATIEQALADATPEWASRTKLTQTERDTSVCVTLDEQFTGWCRSIADAAIIQNAPAWLRALHDETARLESEVQRLTAERDEAGSNWRPMTMADAVERVRRLAMQESGSPKAAADCCPQCGAHGWGGR